MELTLNTGINVQSTLAEVRLASKAGKMQLTAGLFKNQLFQDILNPMAVTIGRVKYLCYNSCRSQISKKVTN